MNNKQSIDEQKTITEIYTAPIVDLAHKVDNLSKLAQRNAFITVMTILVIFVLFALIGLASNALKEATFNPTITADTLDFYKKINQAIQFFFVAAFIFLGLIIVRLWINYNTTKKELILFLKPLEQMLIQVTILLDKGDFGEHTKLALRFQIIEAEVSLKRGKSIAETSFFRNGFGLNSAL